jgi:hypothetical protein
MHSQKNIKISRYLPDETEKNHYKSVRVVGVQTVRFQSINVRIMVERILSNLIVQLE